jgi:hypothetical protein
VRNSAMGWRRSRGHPSCAGAGRAGCAVLNDGNVVHWVRWCRVSAYTLLALGPNAIPRTATGNPMIPGSNHTAEALEGRAGIRLEQAAAAAAVSR